MLFSVIGVFDSNAAQPKKCVVINSTVSSYSVPPPPYSPGKVYVKSIKVNVTIRHKSGEETTIPTIFEGYIDTNGTETLEQLVDKGRQEAQNGIELLISSGDCPGGDGDPFP